MAVGGKAARPVFSAAGRQIKNVLKKNVFPFPFPPGCAMIESRKKFFETVNGFSVPQRITSRNINRRDFP
jgi:hypothetical protein